MTAADDKLLAEARRRGLLPQQRDDALLAEAQRRGLMKPKPSRLEQAGELAKDYMGTVSTGLARGVGNLIGLPGTMQSLTGLAAHQAANLGRRMTGYPEQPYQDRPTPLIPSAEQATEAILGARQAITGQAPYEPKTGAGRVFQETISALPFPGSMAANIGAGAAAALAGEATRGTPMETPARIVGGLAGGAIPGIAQTIRSTPQRLIAETIQPQQPAPTGSPFAPANQRVPVYVDRAEQLQAEANRLGIPITGAEALAQAMGGNAPLTSLQRVIEQSRRGGPIMNEMMRQRAAANQQAMQQAVSGIGRAPAEPERIPIRVQKAAEKTIQRAEEARTAATTKLYEAAKRSQVPAGRIEAILQDIDATVAGDKTGILKKHLGPLRDMLTAKPATAEAPRVPVTDIENLDRARKLVRDAMDLPAFAAEAVPKETAMHLKRSLKRLKGAMEDASEEFRLGRARHQVISEQIIEPLIEGPMGKLAKTSEFSEQAGIILPKDPFTATPGRARITIRQLQKQDPRVAQDFVHQYLVGHFNRTTRDLVGGENVFGGAKFRATIIGNPQQREILRAVVEELPGGKERWHGFKTFLDVLQAQGRRAPWNSPTEFNRQITEELSGGGVLKIRPTLSTVEKWYDRLRYGQNSEQLARLLTDPESVKKIRQLALLKPSSAKAQALVSELLVTPREVGRAETVQ